MSTLITVPEAVNAYDEALLAWQIRFGYPVIARSVAFANSGTAYRLGPPRNRDGYWMKLGLRNDLWPLLLESLAIGGDGPSVSVTMPENIFVWRGPFQGNLRSLLADELARRSLPQTKPRIRGVFIGDDYVNRMRIRLPHR